MISLTSFLSSSLYFFYVFVNLTPSHCWTQSYVGPGNTLTYWILKSPKVLTFWILKSGNASTICHFPGLLGKFDTSCTSDLFLLLQSCNLEKYQRIEFCRKFGWRQVCPWNFLLTFLYWKITVWNIIIVFKAY